MICRKCQVHIEMDVNFCPNCGAKIEGINGFQDKVESAAVWTDNDFENEISISSPVKNEILNSEEGGNNYTDIPNPKSEIEAIKWSKIAQRYTNIFEEIYTGIYKVSIGSLYGCINQHGVEIIPVSFNEIVEFGDNILLVRLDSLWGLIDSKGNKITEVKYSEIRPYENDLAFSCYDDKIGYLDKSGKEISFVAADKIYQPITEFNYLTEFILNGKHGIVDRNGRIVISPEYIKIEYYTFGNTKIAFKLKTQSGKFIVINKRGRLITKKEYLEVRDPIGEYIVVRDENGYSFINNNGERLEIPYFDEVGGHYGDLLWVKNKYGHSLFRKDGKIGSFYLQEKSEKYTDSKRIDCKIGKEGELYKYIKTGEKDNDPVMDFINEYTYLILTIITGLSFFYWFLIYDGSPEILGMNIGGDPIVTNSDKIITSLKASGSLFVTVILLSWLLSLMTSETTPVYSWVKKGSYFK